MEKIQKIFQQRGVQGIYCISNKQCPTDASPFGMPYVGQACSRPFAKKHRLGIGTRLWDHVYKLKKNIHYNQHLQNAWNKYGADVFEFYILEKVEDVNDLTAREQYWIDKLDAYNDGYNKRELAESNRGLLIKSNLNYDIICGWIERFHVDMGYYPKGVSGSIPYSEDGITWHALDLALTLGWRGLPGNSSLSKLLGERFGIVNKTNTKQYTEKKIKQWIKRYIKDHGVFPIYESGLVEYAEPDGFIPIHWAAINTILRTGGRGLLGNKSLKKLMAQEYITTSEASKYLGISRGVLWKSAIPFVQTAGGHRMFNIKELEKFKNGEK